MRLRFLYRLDTNFRNMAFQLGADRTADNAATHLYHDLLSLPPIYSALCIHAAALIPVSSLSAIPAIPGRDFVYNLMNVRYIMWVDRGALGHLIFYVLFFS